MSKVAIFLAKGFEPTEAVTLIDLLRRAKNQVDIVAVTTPKDGLVTSIWGIKIGVEINIDEFIPENYDLIYIPGGIMGVENLLSSKAFISKLSSFAKLNRWMTAICAGPQVLGKIGVTKGVQVTHYPGCDKYLDDAIKTQKLVVVDHNIITGRGPAASFAIAIKIIGVLNGNDVKEQVKKAALLV